MPVVEQTTIKDGKRSDVGKNAWTPLGKGSSGPYSAGAVVPSKSCTELTGAPSNSDKKNVVKACT